MQFRKVAETSENASRPRSSISLWRKYLNLYPVKLQVKVRMLLYSGKPPCMRMKAPQPIIFAHTSAYHNIFVAFECCLRPARNRDAELPPVASHAFYPDRVHLSEGLQVLNKQHASFRTSHHNKTAGQVAIVTKLQAPLLVHCNTFERPASSGRGATEGSEAPKNNESWWKVHSISHLQAFSSNSLVNEKCVTNDRKSLSSQHLSNSLGDQS